MIVQCGQPIGSRILGNGSTSDGLKLAQVQGRFGVDARGNLGCLQPLYRFANQGSRTSTHDWITEQIFEEVLAMIIADCLQSDIGYKLNWKGKCLWIALAKAQSRRNIATFQMTFELSKAS